MIKQSMVYPYNVILFHHQKEWSMDTCCNMEETQKHYATWKEVICKRPRFIYHSYELANLWRQITGCQGLWGRGMKTNYLMGIWGFLSEYLMTR